MGMGFRKEPDQINGYPVKNHEPPGADRQVERFSQRRQTRKFTNGCFDILPIGRIS